METKVRCYLSDAVLGGCGCYWGSAGGSQVHSPQLEEGGVFSVGKTRIP